LLIPPSEGVLASGHLESHLIDGFRGSILILPEFGGHLVASEIAQMKLDDLPPQGQGHGDQSSLVV
jgi:hypothetical protein